MDRTTTQVGYGLIVGLLATVLTTSVALSMGWIDKIDPLELFAVATSYTCTYLCVMQVRLQYIFALVTTALYSWLFFNWGLYGSVLASLYVIPAVVYGWFRWGRDEVSRPVTWTNPTHYSLYALLGIGGWAATYYAAQYLGIGIPLLDSAILVLTIIAQFMMDNKKLENWIVWFVLNIIAIILYFQTGIYLAAMQYILFLANTVFGFAMWYLSMPSLKKATI